MLQLVKTFLSRLKIWAPITTVVGVGIGLPVAICSTATFQDMLVEYGWDDAAKFADATVGQFYAISDDGSTREPLCDLKERDFAPILRPIDIGLVNGLGKALPVLPQFAMYLGIERGESNGYYFELGPLDHKVIPTGSLLYFQRKIFGAKDPKQLSGLEQEEAIRFRNCEDAVFQRAEDDFCIAEIFDAIVESKSHKTVAVDLQPLCIIVPDKPKKVVPQIGAPSIWTATKRRLGLISVEPVTNR